MIAISRFSRDKNLSEIECKGCLSGDCYHLLGQDIASCYCYSQYSETFFSESDQTKTFYCKIHLVVKFLVQNLTFHVKVSVRIEHFKMHTNCQICPYYGVKWIKSWFFSMQNFSKIWFFKKKFSSKSETLQRTWPNIWRLAEIPTQNLTRCKIFNSESRQRKKF